MSGRLIRYFTFGLYILDLFYIRLLLGFSLKKISGK